MFKKKPKRKEKFDFPDNLHDLGYKVSENGQLQTLEGEPYNFDVKDRPYNEALYDVILGQITSYISEQLQHQYGLVKTLLPIGATEADIHTHIFLSPDYRENERMIIFIPATTLAAGIWSRRALTDQSIPDGGMLTYTGRVLRLGCSLVITNPNEVYWYKGKAVTSLPKPNVNFEPIPHNKSPDEHVDYVFKNFVIPSAAQKIYIIASSYGGHCAISMMQNYFEELKDRVKGIEFAVTTHSIDFVKNNALKVWVRERCRNWVVSDEPIDVEIIDPRFGCVNFSSGCQLNDLVVPDVIDRTFAHIERRLDEPDNWQDVMASNDIEDEEESEALQRDAEVIFANTTLVNAPNGVDILPAELRMNEKPEELDPNWL